LAVKLAQVAVMPVVGKVGAPPAAELQAASRSFVAGNPIAFAAFALLGVVIYLIAILFTQGGTVFAVSELYLGRATTIGQSFSRAKGELGTLFGVLFLNGLVTLVSFLLLIIPGIYMMCRLCVAVPAALLENLGPRDSLERSFALTKDNAGRAFLIYLLYFVILYAAVALFCYAVRNRRRGFAKRSRHGAHVDGPFRSWLIRCRGFNYSHPDDRDGDFLFRFARQEGRFRSPVDDESTGGRHTSAS